MKLTHRISLTLRVGTVVAVLGMALGACGSSSAGSPKADGTEKPGVGGSSPVLPVTSNPISNDSTVEGLTIDEVLVENNEDAAGKAVDDHLEIALTNTGTIALSGFEVFYTFTDRKTDVTESYYFQLPDTFTIPAGGSRVAHFDDTGATDHFPVNKFSLYSTSTNAQDVSVTVSAGGAAVATATVKKDKGGPEEAD